MSLIDLASPAVALPSTATPSRAIPPASNVHHLRLVRHGRSVLPRVVDARVDKLGIILVHYFLADRQAVLQRLRVDVDETPGLASPLSNPDKDVSAAVPVSAEMLQLLKS